MFVVMLVGKRVTLFTDIVPKVTDILSVAAPYIIRKVEDIILDEGIKKLGSIYIDKVKGYY